MPTEWHDSLVRIAAVGSVDDGKSTLIGRMLLDAGVLPDDQLADLSRHGLIQNLAYATDGLRDERRLGITIDVAYRYFATENRRFILADTPGHETFTRNMVTGASTADAALILIDATHGLTLQTKRHALIASLLRVPNVIVCVNKMDLVDYEAAVFGRIVGEFSSFSAGFHYEDLRFIPISALHGANVVRPSSAMQWFRDRPLLSQLETLPKASHSQAGETRLPVQASWGPHGAERLGGRLAGGSLRVGDRIHGALSGRRAVIQSIEVGDRSVESALAPLSVAVRLSPDISVGRGELLCRPEELPKVSRLVDAMLCWVGNEDLDPNRSYLLSVSTQAVEARVAAISYQINPATLERSRAAGPLKANGIGHVQLELESAIAYDAYRENRATGSFILIDPITCGTMAAGMLEERA